MRRFRKIDAQLIPEHGSCGGEDELRDSSSKDFGFNVIAGINLSPSVSWSHDVEGYGPNFTEDAKAISLGLNADYANKYNASLSYTNFFDGKYNTSVDRDFAAVSFSVSF